MKYDFDRIIDRHHTHSIKWNVEQGELPMWIADMDFAAAPPIIDAIQKRASHGVFGYSMVPDEWYEAYINWWDRRHHFKIEKEWMMFCSSVVPAISSIVRKLTTPAEKVLLQTPVYNAFFNSILDNGRNVIENELKYDEGNYSIDFVDLEEKLSAPQTTMMILCNPHNPIGKIWDRKTLERIGELCWKHHVLVLADEIHCDLTNPECEYIPFASVSEKCKENTVVCVAPSKTFNLAGLQTSAVIVPNPVLRQKVNQALRTDEIMGINAFAMDATITAFSKCEDWLQELNTYIYENKKIAAEFFVNELPQIRLVPSQATYLLWLEYTGKIESAKEFSQFIRTETGLFLVPGSMYGKAGEQFLRMNIACPKAILKDGLERLKKSIQRWELKR